MPIRDSLRRTDSPRRRAARTIELRAAVGALLIGALSFGATVTPAWAGAIPASDAPSAPAPDSPSPEPAPEPAESAAPTPPAPPTAETPAGSAAPDSTPASPGSPSPSPSPAGSPPETAVDCDAIPVADDDRAPRDACLAARGVNVAAEKEGGGYKKPAKNPKLADFCGIDLAVVLDKSASIGRKGMRDLKRAADTFTDALVDTGSQVSVTAFDTDAEVLLDATDLTSGAGIDAIQGSYRGLASNGFTNWTNGLRAAKGTFETFEDGLADLTIVITDGNPNTVDPRRPGRYPDGSPRAVNPAISQANAIKGEGSHMLVIAVGDVDLKPITLISGREEFDGRNIATADYLQTKDYDSLAQDLRAVAVALCGGSVIVHKRTDDGPAADWTFTALSSDISPKSQKTDATGTTGAFEVSGFTKPTRWITFQEEQRDDYYLGGVECDTAVAEIDEAAGTWDVEVGVDDIVHCTVLNHKEEPPHVDLHLAKAADPGLDGEPVSSGATPPDTIEYALELSNRGTAPAYNVDLTDTLPEGVVFVPGSQRITTTPDSGDASRWIFTEDGGGLRFTYAGAFRPGDVMSLTFSVQVGQIPQPDRTVPIPNLVNRACVAHTPPPGDDGRPKEPGPGERCATAETPVKSIALAGKALCVSDAPWFEYDVTPVNVSSLPTIALIWWTPAAFGTRNPAIPASDTAALLADGASQVDSVTPPPGWTPGDPITGRQLWPGAALDASGKAIDWPGWTLRPDGTWVLDPNAPFYDLRQEAIVEIRVNPSNDVIAVYPPATPDCNAAPPGSQARPARMATTGFDAATLTFAALVLAVLGSLATGAAVMMKRRRQSS